jgi:hypothetical protein
MAWNRNISVYRGVKELHFTIRGEFTDALAFELVDCLQRNYERQPKVFFHTGGLEQIRPSSAEMFIRHLNRLPIDRDALIFTGGNAASLALES